MLHRGWVRLKVTPRILILTGLVFATGCQAVTVQVPPEVDFRAVKTVALVVVDPSNDPAPVGVLLRAEVASEIRQRLPTLTIVKEPADADATLWLEIAGHGIGPAAFRTSVDTQTKQASCAAWQEVFLIVDASVRAEAKSAQLWQALLEARRRISLDCIVYLGPIGAMTSPAYEDPQLVKDIVSNLSRRLAGYTRTEFR